MGAAISNFIRNFSYTPLLNVPVCFRRRSKYSISGEHRGTERSVGPMTEAALVLAAYDGLEDALEETLKEYRQLLLNQKDESDPATRAEIWLTGVAISFANPSTGLISFDDFRTMLVYLGSDTVTDKEIIEKLGSRRHSLAVVEAVQIAQTFDSDSEARIDAFARRAQVLQSMSTGEQLLHELF